MQAALMTLLLVGGGPYMAEAEDYSPGCLRDPTGSWFKHPYLAYRGNYYQRPATRLRTPLLAASKSWIPRRKPAFTWRCLAS